MPSARAWKALEWSVPTAPASHPEAKAPARFCVGIVASAGGIDALSRVLAPLPENFPASILIVLHIMRDQPSRLAEVLGRKTLLGVSQAVGGESLDPGTVLVAPPNRHLVACADGRAALSDAPPQHFSRPSGDPLFLSMAEHYGSRAIAVVLTGFDGDGARGLLQVKEAGGTTLVQDEATSLQFSMPRTAIKTGAVDHVLGVDGIAAALQRLVSG